jgi:PKD repeat protein
VLHFSGAESEDSDGFVRVYAWDFGDGRKAEGAFVTHQYAEPGTYTMTLQIQDNSDTTCNTSSAVMQMEVREPDDSSINGPAMVCVGKPFEYTVEVDTQSVEWHLNTGITATGTTFEHTFETPGIYQLQAKIGIDWMPTKEITAFRLPKMSLPQQLDVYPGDLIVMQPVYSTDLPLQFHWNMGNGAEFNAERVEYQYNTPGEYPLQLHVTMQGGPECLQQTYPIPVIVHAPPEVTIRPTPERIFTGGARDAVTFDAVLSRESGQWNYAWDFGDGGSAIGQRVSHTYRQSGLFTVTVTLTDPLLRTAQKYVFSKEIEVKTHNGKPQE